MDSLGDPEINELILMKCSQAGGSESCVRNALGYYIDQDPGPALIVFPAEDAAKKNMIERVWPMIRDTPELRRHLLSEHQDVSQLAIKLTSMEVKSGWAGSPQSLASDPRRYVFLDEVDKYPVFAGKDAAPAALADARTRTYGHRKKVVYISTPTTAKGVIYCAWKACPDRRTYHVPCPECGEMQPLDWGQIKHDAGEDGEKAILAIEAGAAKVWLECRACLAHIDESKRDSLLEKGVWVSEGYPIGEHPKSRKRAYHVNGLMATIGTMWRDLVAKYIAVKDDLPRRMEFWNQELGEPFLDTIATVGPENLVLKADRGYKRGLVPKWAARLMLTCDTQRDHFYWLLRAWGKNRSRMIDFGTARTFEDLDAIRTSRFKIDGYESEEMGVALTLIDSGGGAKTETDGSRTDQVYKWARKDPTRVLAIKGWGGHGRPQRLVSPRQHTYRPPGDAPSYEASYFLLDTHSLKDMLAALTDETKSKPEDWEIFDPGEERETYFKHMTSEHKVAVRKGQSMEERWVQTAERNRNDWFDCYDEDTDVLTLNGWMRFRSLSGDEKLATVNLATDKIEYQNPTALIDRSYSGSMVKIGGEAGSRANLLVTPNHRMVLCNVRTGKPFIRPASELKYFQQLKCRAGWSGVQTEAPFGLDSEAWAELLGWYVAEGYCNSYVHHSQPSSVKRRVVIYQNPGGKYERIAALLAKLPCAVQRESRSLSVASKDLHDILSPLGNKYTKRVPAWVKASPPHVIRAFLRGAVDGDGWHYGNGEAYATVSPGLAGDVQELYLKAGFTASIIERDGKPYDIRGRSGNAVRQYHVHRSKRRRLCLSDWRRKPNFETVDYAGRVYCATVPNGTLIVRRGGKMIVCGNCEVYQLAAAELVRVDLLLPEERITVQRTAEIKARSSVAPAGQSKPNTGRYSTPDGRPFLANRR